MECSMYGIQPSGLTDRKLLKYARLFGPKDLPAPWVEELLKRLEERVDNDKTQ
jgi:hypothetical protein